MAEQACGGAHALILKKMDELAESSRIGSMVDGAGEGRRLDGALRTAGVAVAGILAVEKISAEGAARLGDGLNGGETGVADGKS